MEIDNRDRKSIIKSVIARMKNYFTAFMVLITLLAYSSVYINPDSFQFPQFVGMAYPYILAADLVYIIALAILKQKSVFVMGAVVLLGFGYIRQTLQLKPSAYFDSTDYGNLKDSSFKIMSFNVRLLDRYNWIKGKNDTRQKIFEFLTYESPDIVCFQEFYARYADSINNETIIRDKLDAKYVIRDYNTDEHWLKTDKGYVIFSRFKLENRRYIIDSANNINGITADADIYGKRIRIFNIHLKSIHLGYDDYSFIDSLDHKNNSKNISGFKNIYQKIGAAYSERCIQASTIDSMIKASPYPVVVCGDFNEPPVSYCYRKVRGNLDDAFCESGTGFGTTMSLKFLKFRIDYILHSPELHSRGFKTHKEYLSDHFAISCSIKP
ncbi:MAG: endonuclease/exonuclease/phosphatase family protein [Bacteroidales bacterium]|nr:endonuclease/exonuclease/phosphatase family protein [Bacteroidales bacterium]